ncbi:MAG: DUF4160 domain-containing protein [Paludibacteraceae bacterium]|nr:DUF4160 domain-containing protein [Paludibacteraceae bacterium]
MPEIYRIFGFKIKFYSDDHEPIHVHVVGNNGQAKKRWHEYFDRNED